MSEHVDESVKRFGQMLNEASARVYLKNLVWDIYKDPKMVEEATVALENILRGKQ